MISMEMAKKLKDAGASMETATGFFGNEIIFIPRLDQLLADIEARGYYYKLLHQEEASFEGKYNVSIWTGREYDGRIFAKANWNEFVSDSPEETAAQALLYILQQDS